MAPTDPEAAMAAARARTKKWKAANPEKVSISGRAYRQALKRRNPEKILANQQAQNMRRRERYRDDPEYRKQVLRSSAARYSADPEPTKARSRRYTAAHRDDPEFKAKGKAKRARPSYQEEQRARHTAWRVANWDRWTAGLRAWATANPDKVHAYSAERRARRKGAPVVEKVDSRVVFERDGWICQLCGEPVDQMLAYPDPMSRSVDHRVALINGGEHSYANVQLAHLVCNVRKWAH